MWLWVRPNSAVNTREVCPRLGAWDVTARPWRTSINSKSPPKGRYVHNALDNAQTHCLCSISCNAFLQPARPTATVEPPLVHNRLFVHRCCRGAILALRPRDCSVCTSMYTLRWRTYPRLSIPGGSRRGHHARDAPGGADLRCHRVRGPRGKDATRHGGIVQ